MSRVRIVTDSASDLPQEIADELGIVVVPLKIRFGDDEFVDREELSVGDFYRRMATSDVLPQTAAPPPGAFEAAFRSLAAEPDTSGIVCIDLSSALSATMQSAENAARAVEGVDIRVVDSRSITGGLGAMAIAAARAGAAGATVDDIVALVDDLSRRTRVYGTLDTLENLKKGGRIGNAQALLGTMLSIKPCVDLSSGSVEEAGRQRTRKKALAWLRDKVAADAPVESLTVIHGQCEDLPEFLDMLATVVDRSSISVSTLGAVIGTHGGPRVMGVCYQVRA
ncbi:MAG: DegV family protein [Acidimicrobiales bacterium]|jgi:DegV family protein with EDD domain|nr:DegV family protein [Acidimicrobiales bacterium]